MRRTVTLERPSKKARTSNKIVTTAPVRTWPYKTQASYRRLFDPFPSKHFARLRWSEQNTLTSQSANQFIGAVIRANSIYDPRYALGGHQPNGHDQYAAIYGYYKVTRAVITATVMSNVDGLVAIAKSPSAVLPTYTSNFVIEDKGCRFNALSKSTSGARNGALINFFNVKENGVLEGEEWTPMGQDPNKPFYFHVLFSPPTDTLTDCNVMITVTYDVEFSGLKTIASS